MSLCIKCSSEWSRAEKKQNGMETETKGKLEKGLPILVGNITQ